MTMPHRPEWLTSIRAFRPGREARPGPDCPGPAVIAALAQGILPADELEVLIVHLANCDHCRAAVAAVVRALADPRVAEETGMVEQVPDPRFSRRRMIAVAVAAAAVLLVAIQPMRLAEEVPDVHRDLPITASAGPAAVSPIGAVGEAHSLRWTSVAGADRYRVTLFYADGSVRYETEVTATTVALPDSVRMRPGETLWWKVDARVGFDRWASSPLIEFSLEDGAP